MRKNRHFVTGILLLVTIGLHAQIKQITGKVTDATGTPVPAGNHKDQRFEKREPAQIFKAYSPLTLLRMLN